MDAILITFCLVFPREAQQSWATRYVNLPPIISALGEISARNNWKYRFIVVDSPYSIWEWQAHPYILMERLRPVLVPQEELGRDLRRPYTCMVRGMGGFAGAWDRDFALLGDYAELSLEWGDSFPGYWNRRAQMGAVEHEVLHLICGECADAFNWWERY